MANTKAVDFAKIKAEEGAPYAKPVQILDNDGNVVNKDLMANFSDDLLVDLMKKMVWERALHEQTMSFSKQGRLGFYAPTWGEEASEMGTAAAFKKNDFLFPAYRDLPQLIQHGATVALLVHSKLLPYSLFKTTAGQFHSHGSFKPMLKPLLKRVLQLVFQVFKLTEWMSWHVMKLLRKLVNSL